MATAVLFVLANFQHSWHSGSKLLSALDTNDANNANQDEIHSVIVLRVKPAVRHNGKTVCISRQVRSMC